MRKVWTLTMNPAIDLEVEVGAVTPNVKIRCYKPRIDAGGGGVNVARALHRIGGRPCALFPEGAALGPFYRNLVEAEGVDFDTFAIDQPMHRINTHCRETDKQRQYRFCLPGPEMEERDWQRALDLLKKVLEEGDLLVTSGSLPLGVPTNFNALTAKVVKEASANFVLDAPGEVLKTLEETGISWIKPNLKEFKDLLGRDVPDHALEKELSAFLEDSVFENILLTMGAKGAIYAGVEGVERIPSPQVEKISSVGAGDSAVAGLVLGLAQGEAHRAACRKAIAAGAAAVMTPGTELLTSEDFESLLDRVNKN